MITNTVAAAFFSLCVPVCVCMLFCFFVVVGFFNDRRIKEGLKTKQNKKTGMQLSRFQMCSHPVSFVQIA